MLDSFTNDKTAALAIEVINLDNYQHWLRDQTEQCRQWLAANRFIAKPASYACIPTSSGAIEKVVFVFDAEQPLWCYAQLASILPEGNYYLENASDSATAALAWGLQNYQYTRYKKSDKKFAKLYISDDNVLSSVSNILASSYLIRDLINTPTEHMGPAQLAEAAEIIATEFSAEFKQLIGEELITENYPAIYTVGRASCFAPRLIEINWGDAQHPQLTLVGKGVCFDSGGLDIKNSANMRFMKKDMGGAAHVLGLARLIMAEKLPLRLRVLIPAVENAISGNAFRPGDIITTRKGLTVEIGNTDAEGRLILADALTEASTQQPELIIDFATLTGAARVALGTDVPVYFTNNDNVAAVLQTSSVTANDLMWRLPLYKPYRKLLDSKIADIDNSGSGGYGGAITAALFLQEFVGVTPWLHIDLMAWNVATQPGRPEGGEAMGLRAVFEFLQQRYNNIPRKKDF